MTLKRFIVIGAVIFFAGFAGFSVFIIHRFRPLLGPTFRQQVGKDPDDVFKDLSAPFPSSARTDLEKVRHRVEALRFWGMRSRLRQFWEMNLETPLSPEMLDLAAESLELNHWYDELPPLEKNISTAVASRNKETPTTPPPRDFSINGYKGNGLLLIKGNWNSNGNLSNIGGWEPVFLKKNSSLNVWTLSIPLENNRPQQVYHCAVMVEEEGEQRFLGSFRFQLSEKTKRVSISLGQPKPAATNSLESALPRRGKLLFIGLDMASWQIIRPLAEAGQLPHFHQWIKTGAYATLESLLAPPGMKLESPVLMMSALTGKVPLQHNIPNQFFVNNVFLNAAPVWSIISRNGVTTDAIGWHGSWPPDRRVHRLVSDAYFGQKLLQEIGGRLPSLMADAILLARQFDVRQTSLDRLAKTLGHLGGHVSTTHPPDLSKTFPAPPTDWQEEDSIPLHKMVTNFLDRYALAIASEFSKDPSDALCLYVRGVDALSHVSWNLFEPLPHNAIGADVKAREETFNDPLSAYYKQLDEELGELSRHYDQLLLYSDHGVFPSRNETSELLLDWGGLLSAIELPIPPSARLTVDLEGSLMITQISMEDRNRISENATNLKSDKDGMGLLTVDLPEESAESVHLRLSPIATEETLARYGRRIFPLRSFLLKPMISWHSPDGVFLGVGASFQKGRIEPNPQLCDVLPTALAILGLPSASDFEGQLRGLKPEILKNKKPSIASYKNSNGWLRLLQSL